MTYAEAIEHLAALGPELPPATPAGPGLAAAPPRKFDLAYMRVLCQALGDPQHTVPSVLIAGTNGKGSTAATLASILHAAGLRTALYTSPHLVRVNERIRLSRSGSPSASDSLGDIPDDDFARLYTRVDHVGKQLAGEGKLPWEPSFFERLTALAFLYFAERDAEIAVFEVGLGGRLDATNVVEPLLSIVTDIALDHQEYLGNTILEIAGEKCGILRRGGMLITLPQHPEANQAIGEAATALGVHATDATPWLPPALRNSAHNAPNAAALLRNRYTLTLDDGELLQVDSPLPGEHQRRNIALAIAAATQLCNRHGYNISSGAIAAGIRNTYWPGRLEMLDQPQDTAPHLSLLIDVAHNPAGAWTLRAALSSLPSDQPRTLIFSCLRDKNLAEMSRILFPLFDSSPDADPERRHDHIILPPIASPRAAPLDDLMAAASSLGAPAIPARDVADALRIARQRTPAGGLIVVTGSVYLVGEARQAALTPEMASA